MLEAESQVPRVPRAGAPVYEGALEGVHPAFAQEKTSKLVKILRDKRRETEARSMAAWALGARSGDAAISALVDVLNDVQDDKSLRESAVEVLTGTCQQRVLRALVKIVMEPGDIDTLREAAAKNLQKSGDKQALEFLLEALDSESWDIRRPVAMALARAANRQADAKLAVLLAFDHAKMLYDSVHFQSLLSLGREYSRVAPILADRDLNFFNVIIARSLAGTSDPTALRALLQVLRSGTGELRLAAAESLRASIEGRDLFERMISGEFGEPPDLSDTVEALVVPLWPDFVIWGHGATSSMDDVDNPDA